MNRLHVRFITWLANRFGYKVSMVKSDKSGIYLEGNTELMRYTDFTGYLSKASPLRRAMYEPRPEPTPINRLSLEELQQIFNEIESKNDIEKTEE